jgi:hypothetical protein
MQRVRQLKQYNVPIIMDLLNGSKPVYEFDFIRSPIESLKTIHGLSKLNWQCTLNHYFKVVRQ